jgi:hypothetical protein
MIRIPFAKYDLEQGRLRDFVEILAIRLDAHATRLIAIERERGKTPEDTRYTVLAAWAIDGEFESWCPSAVALESLKEARAEASKLAEQVADCIRESQGCLSGVW